MKLGKCKIRHLKQALHQAIEYNEGLIDSYRNTFPKRIRGGLAQKILPYEDVETMKHIKRWQREIKNWKELLIFLSNKEQPNKN